jgi:hypothetical protein
MCPAIDNPDSCEIRNVISFLHAKKKSAAEIHRELSPVFGQNLISEGTVEESCRMLCRMDSKNAHTRAFDFFQRYHKDGNKFLNYIERVKVCETWFNL